MGGGFWLPGTLEWSAVMNPRSISGNGASGSNSGSGSEITVDQAGYRREIAPGGIIILRLLDSSPETTEAWFQDCNKLMEGWSPEQRLRYVHHIRRAAPLRARGV